MMNILKTIISALVILIVGCAIVVGLGKVGLSQAWIALMFILYFYLIKGLNLESWLEVVVGGLIGITLGCGMPLLALALGSFGPLAGTIALVVYLVIIFLAIVFNLSGKLALFVNPMMWIFFVIFLIKGVSDLTFLVQYYALFLGMALIVGAVLLILKNISKTKSKAEAKA